MRWCIRNFLIRSHLFVKDYPIGKEFQQSPSIEHSIKLSHITQQAHTRRD